MSMTRVGAASFSSHLGLATALLAVVALSGPLPAVAQATAAKDHIGYYVERFGRLEPGDDPRVDIAFEVFDRVREAADKSTKRLPQLIVIGDRATRPHPWALALPDGHIVLSRRGIEACRTSTADMPACLAYIIGHELAHLARDDFWHAEVYSLLDEFRESEPQSKNERLMAMLRPAALQARKRELAADDWGFVYASLAGYPVERLLDAGPSGLSFFEQWMQQTVTRIQPTHATPLERAQLLRARLRGTAAKLVYFHYGVRLSHFGLCDDAIHFFRAFQKDYPGPSVLNNLGFCYIRLALKAMRPERANHYWLPLVLEDQTRAQTYATRSGDERQTLKQMTGKAGRRALKQAVDYLRKATEISPSLMPASINLATAYLLQGQPHFARGVLEKALTLAPDDPDLRLLDALAIYEQSEPGTDLWPAAAERLKTLAADGDRKALFNLGRLEELRNRVGAAHVTWSELSEVIHSLPGSVASGLCARRIAALQASCESLTSTGKRESRWPWPVVGEGLKKVPDKIQSSWTSTAFGWQGGHLTGNVYRSQDTQGEVLELDGYVQLQVLKGKGLGTTTSIASRCHRGLRSQRIGSRRIWTCEDWAAVAHDETIEQVWRIAR